MFEVIAFSRRAFLVLASVSLGACNRDRAPEPTPAPASSPSAQSSASAGVAPPPTSEKPLKADRADRTHRAGRCGECHDKMYEEWKTTAHAKSDDSAAFAAMRKQGGQSCDRCHAPLVLLDEPAAFSAREGVSCEVCHRIENVRVAEPFSTMELLTAHEVKFGPRCDPTEPYFHRARCNPLFEKSEICAGCHQLYQEVPGGGPPLPVHTEYADFKKTRHAARGKVCQSCHMPGVRAELAIGERERDGVPDHGFLGKQGHLRGTALTAVARASWKPGSVELVLRITNARAGHAVPAGTPGRQLVISVSALDRDGRRVASKEQVFERRLVDATGSAAPFYRATRVDADTRLQAGETRSERFSLEGDDLRRLSISVGFRAVSPELSGALGLPDSAPAEVWTESLEIGPASSGTRSVALRRDP